MATVQLQKAGSICIAEVIAVLLLGLCKLIIEHSARICGSLEESVAQGTVCSCGQIAGNIMPNKAKQHNSSYHKPEDNGHSPSKNQ